MKRLLPLVLAGAMMLTTGATALADNVSDALEKAATMTNDELYAKAQEEMAAGAQLNFYSTTSFAEKAAANFMLSREIAGLHIVKQRGLYGFFQRVGGDRRAGNAVHRVDFLGGSAADELARQLVDGQRADARPVRQPRGWRRDDL